MAIVVEDKQGERVIVDGYALAGFVREKICPLCDSPLIYHADYDADFCPQCNAWHEAACNDPDCDYCRQRPARPLP